MLFNVKFTIEFICERGNSDQLQANSPSSFIVLNHRSQHTGIVLTGSFEYNVSQTTLCNGVSWFFLKSLTILAIW